MGRFVLNNLDGDLVNVRIFLSIALQSGARDSLAVLPGFPHPSGIFISVVCLIDRQRPAMGANKRDLKIRLAGLDLPLSRTGISSGIWGIVRASRRLISCTSTICGCAQTAWASFKLAKAPPCLLLRRRLPLQQPNVQAKCCPMLRLAVTPTRLTSCLMKTRSRSMPRTT